MFFSLKASSTTFENVGSNTSVSKGLYCLWIVKAGTLNQFRKIPNFFFSSFYAVVHWSGKIGSPECYCNRVAPQMVYNIILPLRSRKVIICVKSFALNGFYVSRVKPLFQKELSLNLSLWQIVWFKLSLFWFSWWLCLLYQRWCCWRPCCPCQVLVAVHLGLVISRTLPE